MAQESIHEVVRNRYGAIARSMDSSADPAQDAASCCGSSNACCGEGSDCGSSSNLYDMSLLEGLPVDVTGLSLGCEGTQFTRSNPSCRAA